ncbi:putative esterase [Kalmanozyma brasiliensis GHG001]|uniref:S-formylglutathione hydrolase n=1 Tax=Kalmanozyma brasiliensis (strain GHG001) TaxID=1365824 RepID=V5F205_KALBG|nr:putative esterase [Kalmanozyma brasiliensis GHG001]EST09389.1 putative esterase [Kalmanozyma brasiliensis GHG001]
MSLNKKSANKVSGGTLTKYSFTSSSLNSLETAINVFLPSSAVSGSKVPVLYYLSGLTCTEDNAAQKGGFFNAAEAAQIALVFPDTSPRGAKVDGEDESYDFGSGAGFYLNATKQPWSAAYNMYDYIVKELPSKLGELPIDTSKASIFGHSMGGHGALTLYLKNRGQYKSASAFSPICNPTACPWGKKAFEGYLENGLKEGEQYDATLLLKDAQDQPGILIDSGTADDFYKQGQLLPENFQKVAEEKGFKNVQVRLQDGYDHSYFFISTFAEDHIKFHAKFLKA